MNLSLHFFSIPHPGEYAPHRRSYIIDIQAHRGIERFPVEDNRTDGRGHNADYPHHILLLHLVDQEQHAGYKREDLQPVCHYVLYNVFHILNSANIPLRTSIEF